MHLLSNKARFMHFTKSIKNHNNLTIMYLQNTLATFHFHKPKLGGL